MEMDETTTSIRTYYYLDFDKGNVDSKRMNKVIFEENGIAVMMDSSFEVKVLLQKMCIRDRQIGGARLIGYLKSLLDEGCLMSVTKDVIDYMLSLIHI